MFENVPRHQHDAFFALRADGDARTHHPYGLSPLCSDTIAALGSCTANPLTSALLQRACALDLTADPTEHLRRTFGAAYCQLSPSGTDAEYNVALSASLQGRPLIQLMADPREVGSGTHIAAQGWPHQMGCVVTHDLPLQTHLYFYPLRDNTGHALPLDVVANKAWNKALHAQTAHPAAQLVAHFVPCTKTGLMGLSEEMCRTLQTQRRALVVVDASQGRWNDNDIQRWLAFGWPVIITGSKRWGAPPFCSAVLYPPEWAIAPHSDLQAAAQTPGLKARWALALTHLDNPPPVAQQRLLWQQALTESFLPNLPASVAASVQTHGLGEIATFSTGLSHENNKLLHRCLIDKHNAFIGQPVDTGAGSLLRVALGAGLRTPADMQEPLERVARALHHELHHA